MDFSQELINWYSIHKRDLPWRDTTNPYYIWLSEIILQQTQVKQGLPYYKAFVKTFPTVFDLANASEETVLRLWQGLGYYSRARNLHSAAKYIVFELKGEFPNNYDELLKLKGVGDYTASAIASFAFNEVAAVVDGNVYRVLARYFGIDTPINSAAGIKQFKKLATALIDSKSPATFNQAIMEFGAIQCKPKNPYCSVCPLQNSCVARQKASIDNLPIKLNKTNVNHRYFNYLVYIDRQNNTLLEKRTKKGIWKNLYQFPLVESDRSLNPEEIHLLKLDDPKLNHQTFEWSLYNTKDKVHKLSHQHLHTKFWIIELDKLDTNPIPISSLERYPVPVLIGNFIKEFNFPNLQ